MKVAVNRCFGGFSLSKEAYEFLGLEWDGYGYDFSADKRRIDPNLIKCLEELGKKANGMCANIEIVEIPDGISWEIDDYDGMERVAESHRTW